MDSTAPYPTPEPPEGPAQKVSVSMPASRIAAVKARVGARGFSAYVSAAVERQIQRDLLEELLEASEAETGPPPAEAQEWAAQAFRDAEHLAQAERAAAPGPVSPTREGDPWHAREAG